MKTALAMNDAEPHDLMTVKEAAEFLRVHRSTIYRLLQHGILPGAFRIGADWRVKRSTLHDALQTLTSLSYEKKSYKKKKK